MRKKGWLTAERRMFAKSIIDSDAFLDMPLSTQALYFHLCMRADDEGFVNNPKKIMRMIGVSDDDAKILVAKKFIIPFESGVIVIKHWRIHNYIRADRMKATNYEEERNMLVVKNNNAYTLTDEPTDVEKNQCQSNVSQMSVKCQSNVRQVSDKCQTSVRIGKDSIGKDSIDKNSINTIVNEIVDMYHEECPSLPKVMKLTDKRISHIKARLKKHDKDEMRLAFQKAEASDFLTGRSGKWKCNFDWLIESETNLVKVLEDTYKDRDSVKEKTINDLKKIGMTQDEYQDMERTFG